MTAPLSLRDKQFQYLLGLYGSGLSYNDMLSKYRGGGKSISDLEYAAYLGDPTKSLSDNMDAMISGSGSLSDQMYADSSGGVATFLRTNMMNNPRAATITGTGWLNHGWGTGGAAGTVTYPTGISGPPGTNITTECKKTWTAASDNSSAANTGIVVYKNAANDYYDVLPNTTYTMSVWYRANSAKAKRAQFTAYLYDAGKVYVTGFNTNVDLVNNTWTRISLVFTTPANVVWVRPTPTIAAGANWQEWAIGDTLEATGLLLEKVGALDSYFDGDSNDTVDYDYRWNGAANNSTSSIFKATATTPIDNLLKTSPFYVAHRGSGDVWPEHTITAYSNSQAIGLNAIEVSAQRSAVQPTTVLTSQVTNPGPGTVTNWNSNNSGIFTASYNAAEQCIDITLSGAAVGGVVLSTMYNLGMSNGNGNVILPAVNHQREVEIWVDQDAAVSNPNSGGFVAGQILPANKWTRVVQQFVGTGALAYPLGIGVNMATNTSAGIHCKFRKAMLCENPTGAPVPYGSAIARTTWTWAGAVNNSQSSGPANDTTEPWWFCLHDAGATGLDRTTNGAGDPKTKVRGELETFFVDVTNCGPFWPPQQLRLPDLQTVLTNILADSTAVVFFETKDYSGAAMDDIIAKLQTWFPTKYNTQIVWKSHVSNAPGFTKAKAVGMKCWAYIDYPLDIQQVADAIVRADYVGLPRYDGGTGLTDAEVDTAMAIIGTTIRAISWEPKRRSEIAKLLAKGVDGFVSPTAPYTRTNVADHTQDQFATGKWAAGDNPRDTSLGGVLDTATASLLINSTGTNPSILLGSFCPIASTSYEIEFEMKYDALPAATAHSGLVLCKPDDQKYGFSFANPTGGYHNVFRQNGQLQLYKHDAGVTTGTQVGTTLTTAALDIVNWAKVRIKVTPTAVEMQRMDGTPSAVMSVADTAYRGQYIHVARNHISTTEFVRFRNVKVTLL